MAEGIYSTGSTTGVYARNRFGRKLLGTTTIIGSSCNAYPEGEFSAKVNITGTGVIVPAITNKQIEIIGYSLVASGAAVISIRSSGTDIFGPVSLAANGQINNSNISLKSNESEPIVIVSTSQVGGFINYRIV